MNPRLSNSSLPKPGRSAYGVATAVVLLLIPVVVVYGGNWLQDFLNFGAGVLTLVSLSCSVIWGLVAQDRLLLNTRQRIVAQGIHRVTAVASIAFLILHVGIKLALDHTSWIAAVIPFGLGITGIGGLIGLGTLAGLLMIFVGVTGALRNQFATPAPVAARWRLMHMMAYPAWCSALVHGLYAGRPVKSPLFTYLYIAALLAVMAMLALRAAPRSFKRRFADRVVEILGSPERSGMEDLEASRSRMADAGFESRREPRQAPAADRAGGGSGGAGGSSGGLYQTPAPQGGDTSTGFAAAYRAVNTTGQTGQMNLQDIQATAAFPRPDGSVSTSGNWPIPSPPPVGEAPPSAYDPLQDTGYNIPVYGNQGNPGAGGRDVYDTGETNARYATYNSGDTFNRGPATEPSPGAQASGSGEPWNTPSGGYR